MRKAFNVKNGDLVDENQGKAEREARFFLLLERSEHIRILAVIEMSKLPLRKRLK